MATPAVLVATSTILEALVIAKVTFLDFTISLLLDFTYSMYRYAQSILDLVILNLDIIVDLVIFCCLSNLTSTTMTTSTTKKKPEEVDLTEETTTIPEPKTNREKAMDLALKYNFVSPVTSLVVARPNATNDEDSANSTTVVDPVPLSQLRSYSSYGGSSFRSHSFAKPMMANAPQLSRAGFSAPNAGGIGVRSHGSIHRQIISACPVRRPPSLPSPTQPSVLSYDSDTLSVEIVQYTPTTTTTTQRLLLNII